MKLDSTTLLKLILVGAGAGAFLFYGIAIPSIAYEARNGEYLYILYPILVGFFLTSIPYYLGLYQIYKILTYIDSNNAFSDVTVKTLRNIRNCGLAGSVIFLLTLPFIYFAAELDDAPGLILIGMVFVTAPFAIAVVASVIQKVLQSAIEIKSENELTV